MIEAAYDWRAILYALLAIAAINDVHAYRIPNWLPISIVASLIIVLMTVSAPVEEFSSAAVAGVIGFGVGFIFFQMRLMGGGDGKLFAAAAAWFDASALLSVGFFVSVAGVVLSIVYLGVRTRRPAASSPEECGLIHAALKTRVPYGVAIAVGVIVASIVPNIGFGI